MHRILCPNSFLIELERKELSGINGDLREEGGVHFLGTILEQKDYIICSASFFLLWLCRHVKKPSTYAEKGT